MKNKKISILVPCYNEEENVVQISKALEEELKKNCSNYDYEICFIDNCSTDKTRILIRQICSENSKIKAIFNARNFGGLNSPYYGMQQLDGDCIILFSCDFQDPIELIPKMVLEWEKGAKIVSCIKNKSDENKIVRFLRTCYYKTIMKLSEIEQIEHFTGFGLYDKSFIEIMKDLKDPQPWLRGIVAELGFKRINLYYKQNKRKAGKTHWNWYSLYDISMRSFTSYTKIVLRIATIIGFIISFMSFGVAIFYFIQKLLHWNSMAMGIAPIIIGVFLLGGLQLFFIGFLGEFIMSINTRLMNRPLVIEEERINWK